MTSLLNFQSITLYPIVNQFINFLLTKANTLHHLYHLNLNPFYLLFFQVISIELLNQLFLNQFIINLSLSIINVNLIDF